MHVQLRLDGKQPRRWHIGLLQALAALPGVTASANAAPGPGALPASTALLFRFESALHKIAPHHSAPVPASELAPFAPAGQGRPELVIDLCGDVPNDGARLWRLLFSGTPGETALLAALAGGQAPFVVLSEGARIITSARPGSERPDVLLAGFDDALGRVKALILGAVRDGGRQAATPVPPDPGSTRSAPVFNPVKTATGQIAAKLARRLERLRYHKPHWRIGWRKLQGRDLYDLRQHPASGWTDLPDDGQRFYADPFPIEYQGKTILFAEEFPYATSKGIISAVEFGPDGPLGTPQPVLELPCHLSYPFVFGREGQMWMIPESSGAGTIELFRAEKFPGGWVREAVLVSGLVAGDATLVEYGGTFWMFATVQGEGGSYSDALHLWSAPDFRGPWKPHPGNPVLIDKASARSAGRMVQRGGALLRPVQDCRAGYGSALGIARILQLDGQGYEQKVETVLGPGPLWPGQGLHTLNSGGGFEFIDGVGRSRR